MYNHAIMHKTIRWLGNRCRISLMAKSDVVVPAIQDPWGGQIGDLSNSFSFLFFFLGTK